MVDTARQQHEQSTALRLTNCKKQGREHASYKRVYPARCRASKGPRTVFAGMLSDYIWSKQAQQTNYQGFKQKQKLVQWESTQFHMFKVLKLT